ncbi:MAG TPA: HD domain-containing phosphohydrolase [Candidatus Deferrimicrobium sp.]|nr:HD domain-containing phosphohydrolase [Candidatus Deferrimicrobium sp.]
MKAQEVFLAILTDLVRSIQAAAFYPETHQRVQEPLTRLLRSVRNEAKRLGGNLSMGFFGDRIVVDQFPFHGSNLGIERLAGRMASRGIEKVAIGEAVTFPEMKRFVYFVAGVGEADGSRPWIQISFGRIHGDEPSGFPASGGGEALPAPQVLAGATEVLKEVLRSIAVKGPLGNVEEGRDIVAAVMKGLREEEFLIDRMMRLQARDDYTVAHSLNVCVMVVAQAARLDLSEGAIRDIGLAALLHDIGKELVPLEILNKKGKLDPGEFAKISLHPLLGATHLRKMSLGSDLPVIVCYEHHIRHDRSGYPTPRFTDVPHPASLMTQIADVYDALRTYRPYRTSLDRETALGILREGRGTEFEPVLLDRFLGMVA